MICRRHRCPQSPPVVRVRTPTAAAAKATASVHPKKYKNKLTLRSIRRLKHRPIKTSQKEREERTSTTLASPQRHAHSFHMSAPAAAAARLLSLMYASLRHLIERPSKKTICTFSFSEKLLMANTHKCTKAIIYFVLAQSFLFFCICVCCQKEKNRVNNL